jgi:hypothetical protein
MEMSIAERMYSYEHGWNESKPQKRLNKKIKFRPIDLARKDAYYLIDFEKLLCIYFAIAQDAGFPSRALYGDLGQYFKFRISGNYHEAYNNLRNNLNDLFLIIYDTDSLFEWRKKKGIIDNIKVLADIWELPSPPHYSGRQTMPIPQFKSIKDIFDIVFNPIKKERFYPVSCTENGKPFIKGKYITINSFEPEKYGYFLFEIDFTYDKFPYLCWTWKYHSKPNQSFVDFLIELSSVWDKLKRCRIRHNRYVTQVMYDYYKDTPKYQCCTNFYLK